MSLRVEPLVQIMDFCTCLPFIGIPALIGGMIPIEGVASKILFGEPLSEKDLPVRFREEPLSDRLKPLFVDYKNQMVLTYGKRSCLGGIQGFLTLVTAVALTILGIMPIAVGIFFGIASLGMIALAIGQVYRVNKFLSNSSA